MPKNERTVTIQPQNLMELLATGSTTVRTAEDTTTIIASKEVMAGVSIEAVEKSIDASKTDA